MKVMWCWRCKMGVPMLDEEEYEVVSTIHARIDHSPELEPAKFHHLSPRMAKPMLEKYREITGFEETNYLAIFHHRISIYGDPCVNCGKPLRTPQAAFCAACGHKK